LWPGSPFKRCHMLAYILLVNSIKVLNNSLERRQKYA
jgi:hypothetical protein